MDRLAHGRRWLLRTALSYLGSPYIWGGDDPSGFDCSGFVLECLKTTGRISEHEDMTAEGLRRRFSNCQIDSPCSGALMFRINPENHLATHVVICLDKHYQIGASGGDRFTDAPDIAWRKNAYVKIRPADAQGRAIHEFYDPLVCIKAEPPTKSQVARAGKGIPK